MASMFGIRGPIGDLAAANYHFVQRLYASFVALSMKERFRPALAGEPANHCGCHPVDFYSLRTAAPA
jgi:hypothetical protein